jgi:hypothetical protein
MRKKRPAVGFIVWMISPRYSRIEFIFNFNDVFIFKFLNLYAQLLSLWRTHASWRRTSLDHGSTMSMLTYTTRAVLPGTRYLLSSSCGPPPVPIEQCSLGHTSRWAALAVLHVPLERYSPWRACQWAALAVSHVPQEHFLTGTYPSWRCGLHKEISAEHINSKI